MTPQDEALIEQVTAELILQHTKVATDPGTGRQARANVVTPSMLAAELERRSGRAGWIVELIGSKFDISPPQPRRRQSVVGLDGVLGVCGEPLGDVVDLRDANDLPLVTFAGATAGSVSLHANDGSETILLRGDGKIFIRGEQVDDNRVVYEAMCKLLGVSIAAPTSERPMAIFDPGPSARDEDLDWLTRSGGG